MKRVFILTFISLLVWTSCTQRSTDYCTVKGTVEGLEEGTKLELQDEFNHFKVVGRGTVKNGAFVIHPDISSPTHVYLYTKDEMQLKDFYLEPGTIVVKVDADDEEDYVTGAVGTPSNDIVHKYRTLLSNGDQDAAKVLMDSVLGAEQTGVLALDYAKNYYSSSKQALGVLDRLSPELTKFDYVSELREKLTRRLKTEPGEKYIDMEYPDRDGNLISLSSVVNHHDNRYVLVDFWATWCGSCVKKIPELVKIYTKYHEKGLEIYSLSMDPKGRYDTWKNFVAENGMTWINVCDGSGGGAENSKVWYDYALYGIPTTLLIDCQTKKIITRDDPDLELKLEELLTTQDK